MIARSPEVLPSEDLDLGPLVAFGRELDPGHGPLDLPAVHATGQTATIEFERGTENPDVGKVAAQLLDYGAALWRHTPESLRGGAGCFARARRLRRGDDGT